jgi:CHAT domain-containing protein
MRWMPLLLLLMLQVVPASAQKTAAQSLDEATKMYRSGNLAAARHALEQTIDIAVQEKDKQVEAESRYYLGTALSQSAQYDLSNVQLRAALPLFEQLGNQRRQAGTCSYLGRNAYGIANRVEARADFEKAMKLYEAIGDERAVANEHENLAFVTDGAERFEHIQRGLELARKGGDKTIEAKLLHTWADGEYGSNNFDAAFDRLNQARSLLEELNDRPSLASVLTSIGRLYRVHGHAEEALSYYERARNLQKQAGDTRGVIQSLNAMGVALNHLGRSSEALRCDEEALQLARETDSSLLIKFILQAVASTQMYLGRNEAAAAALEEARKMQPPRAETLCLLSTARFQLGQYDAAWKAADEALTMKDDAGEITRHALQCRAQALWKLARTQEALRDIRQLNESLEQARAKLVPSDFMKQGFSDTDRRVTTLSIHILLDSGEEREALETAERARGRAFLDLLATKSISTDPLPNRENEVAKPLLLMRGGTNSSGPGALPSPGSASPASAEDALALARRLDSTILVYWVDDNSTIIWTVAPRGRIACARTDSGAPTLEKWINEALHVQKSSSKASKVQIVSRGGDALLAGRLRPDSWRRLYDALIRPVRTNLPSKPGSHLTIIPSGPLFRLSFAALMDERGRYLVENYALNYSPAIEVLQYTRQAQQRVAAMPARYLLVANPSGMPLSDGKQLPALPGSDKEVQSISQIVGHGSVVLLHGKQADEATVREAMPKAKVIHFATHGVIDNSNPLSSFLAFGRTSGQPDGDGRLSAEEVYSLDLHADLVVLSACRTGLGRISGDGVAGLVRAFFYAGAASVVSTVWDVADEPTAQLLASFYRSFGNPNTSKSQALRQAQLRLLQSLRAGQIHADTPFGRLPLPEDPILWAGFVLMGEP